MNACHEPVDLVRYAINPDNGAIAMLPEFALLQMKSLKVQESIELLQCRLNSNLRDGCDGDGSRLRDEGINM